MNKVLVILGPTATGKTDLGIVLAKKYGGEIIACDSRQVYRGLDIGTGKLPGASKKVKVGDKKWEVDGVNLWMYDVVDPDIRYTAFDYANEARKVLEDILSRGKLPIVVGGSGLYLKALLEGFNNNIPANSKLRLELEQRSLSELQKTLKALSTEKYNSLNNSDRHNPRRLVRYIEVLSYPHKESEMNDRRQHYSILMVGLSAPKQILYSRIDTRLLNRINQGLIEEAEKLVGKGLGIERLKELGLEYGVLADLLEKKLTKEQFIEKLKTQIHQYAKRQLTWFKRDQDIKWFDITDKDYLAKVESEVDNWYNRGAV